MTQYKIRYIYIYHKISYLIQYETYITIYDQIEYDILDIEFN